MLFAQKQGHNLNQGQSDSKYYPLLDKPTCSSIENCLSLGKCVRIKLSRKSARQVRAFIWLIGQEWGRYEVGCTNEQSPEVWRLHVSQSEDASAHREYLPRATSVWEREVAGDVGEVKLSTTKRAGKLSQTPKSKALLQSHKCKCSETQEQTRPRE